MMGKVRVCPKNDSPSSELIENKVSGIAPGGKEINS